jgi:general secretion pathway protein H
MKDRGFSLIELMVVLILISLSIALVTPSLSRFSRTVELKAAAKKVSGILRYCRSEAVNKGQVYQALFDSNLREVRVQSMESKEEKDEKWEGKATKKTYSLPEGIRMKEVDIPSPQYPSDLPLIEFYPNGGSNGGAILLDTQDRTGYKIKVDFLTGMVRIERMEGFGR